MRVTRSVQARCGDIIEALFTAVGAEPELADAVAEGQRRHREGARLTIDRIQELHGLRNDVPPQRAQALFALSTNHEAWRELTVASARLGPGRSLARRRASPGAPRLIEQDTRKPSTHAASEPRRPRAAIRNA